MTKMSSKSARVNMVWRGDELENLHECMALLRLNDEAATVRYLVSRGMEAMSPQLAQRKFITKLQAQYSPQELLPMFEQLLPQLK